MYKEVSILKIKKTYFICMILIAALFMNSTKTYAYELSYELWDYSTIKWYWGGQVLALSSTQRTKYQGIWEDAIDSWNDCGLDAEFLKVSSLNYADFTVDVGYTQASSYYGYTTIAADTDGYIWNCAAYINMNNTYITSYNLVAQSTSAHELGHVFGLDHVFDTTCLMCQGRNRFSVISPTNDEMNGVNFLY